MTICEAIKMHLMPRAGGITVEDVRIGLVYTAVHLENGRTGLALTFREGMTKGCNVFEGLTDHERRA